MADARPPPLEKEHRKALAHDHSKGEEDNAVDGGDAHQSKEEPTNNSNNNKEWTMKPSEMADLVEQVTSQSLEVRTFLAASCRGKLQAGSKRRSSKPRRMTSRILLLAYDTATSLLHLNLHLSSVPNKTIL